jgi:hypothetical protein
MVFGRHAEDPLSTVLKAEPDPELLGMQGELPDFSRPQTHKASIIGMLMNMQE